MSSRTEGIALLSMYNDEEEEDDDNEAEQHQQPQEEEEEEQQQPPKASEDESGPSPCRTPPLPPSRTPPYAEAEWNPNPATSPLDVEPSPSPAHPQPPAAPPLPSSRPSTPVVSLFPAAEALGARGRRAGPAFAIVDYAHDENALSPEREDGEMVADLDMLDADLQDADGSYEDKSSPAVVQGFTPSAQATPQYEHPEVTKSETSLAANAEEKEPDASDACQKIDTPVEMQEDVDPLKKFLPQPPTTRCSQELQEKIIKFLALKRAGKSFNNELRNMKAYRNPDFLQHAVRYQEINQMGTCFSRDVFDPEGYDKSDYYNEIEADMKRELERKEQERKRSPKVEFVVGGTQPGITVSAPNSNTQISVSSAPALMTSLTSVSALDVKDGRQNKKSKWDKVDFDPKNPLQSGGTSILPTACTHSSTLLSAASIGTGYSVFAQQKRREAEEKQSGDRKYDRRS